MHGHYFAIKCLFWGIFHPGGKLYINDLRVKVEEETVISLHIKVDINQAQSSWEWNICRASRPAETQHPWLLLALQKHTYSSGWRNLSIPLLEKQPWESSKDRKAPLRHLHPKCLCKVRSPPMGRAWASSVWSALWHGGNLCVSLELFWFSSVSGWPHSAISTLAGEWVPDPKTDSNNTACVLASNITWCL